MSVENKISATMEYIVRSVKSFEVQKRANEATGKTVAELPVLKGFLPRVAFVHGVRRGYASLVHVLLMAGFKLTGQIL